MATPANKVIGSCPCYGRDCDAIADVKKMNGKSGLKFLNCPECGVIRPTGLRFQSYIEANAKMPPVEPPEVEKPEPSENSGDDWAPETVATAEPEKEPVEKDAETETKSKSFFPECAL